VALSLRAAEDQRYGQSTWRSERDDRCDRQASLSAVLATLWLPSVFTLLFALIDVALLLNLLSIIQTSTNLSKAAGWVVMAASAVVAYLFFGSASLATGGKEVPLGPPILQA